MYVPKAYLYIGNYNSLFHMYYLQTQFITTDSHGRNNGKSILHSSFSLKWKSKYWNMNTK